VEISDARWLAKAQDKKYYIDIIFGSKTDQTSIDLHVRENSKGFYKSLFEEASKVADVLALCGDLTDHGTVEEAKVLVEEMLSISIPVVGVLGNHDFENGQEKEIAEVLGKAKMILLGDEPWEYKDVSFAGVKGFGGGF